jgi:hypothetical protein
MVWYRRSSTQNAAYGKVSSVLEGCGKHGLLASTVYEDGSRPVPASIEPYFGYNISSSSIAKPTTTPLRTAVPTLHIELV